MKYTWSIYSILTACCKLHVNSLVQIDSLNLSFKIFLIHRNNLCECSLDVDREL